MTKQKKSLMWTILAIGIIQMPSLALISSIATIHETVFPMYSLGTIQTVMQLTNFVSPVLTIIMSFLISRHVVTKRFCVIVGLFLLGGVALFATTLNTQFWMLCTMCALLGIAHGLFVPVSASILFDNFNEDERRVLVGYQTSAINGGGILMSVLGGFLATQVWYGGWYALYLGLPVAVMAILFIPKVKKGDNRAADGKELTAEDRKFNVDMLFYVALIMVFSILYGVMGGNISSLISSQGVGTSATSGIITGISMAGGVTTGVLFGKISSKLDDQINATAYLLIAIGFTIIAFGSTSIVAIAIGAFIAGGSMSMIMPQCNFGISNRVTVATSAVGSMLGFSIAPGLGSFLSPVIMTNVTSAIFGPTAIKQRYFFTAGVALVLAIVVSLLVAYRKKRGISS